MALFNNEKELIEATKEWIKDNPELYEYLTEFEHDIINKNRLDEKALGTTSQ